MAGSATGSHSDEPLFGPPFAVNVYTTGTQNAPAVAALPNGRFVVTWPGPTDGSGTAVFARLFESDGQAPPEQQVNTYTTGGQGSATVSANADGQFLVCWISYGQDGDDNGIFARLYSPDGQPAGAEFQVNTFTAGSQKYPRAAAHDNGFVVVWQDAGQQDGSSDGIFGQKLTRDGLPHGSEFQVNSYTFVGQSEPSVAAARDGRFVVVWQDQTLDGDVEGVFARRFDSDGVPQGDEIQVNTYTAGPQRSPVIGADDDGAFVVAWESFAQDGSGYGVFGRAFTSDGAPAGPEFLIPETTLGYQRQPSIAFDGSGALSVAWAGQDSDNFGVLVRRFSPSGIARGGEYQINIFEAGRQWVPAIAATRRGQFVVVWQSDDQDGDDRGVFGREGQWALFADGFESGDTSAWSSTVP